MWSFAVCNFSVSLILSFEDEAIPSIPFEILKAEALLFKRFIRNLDPRDQLVFEEWYQTNNASTFQANNLPAEATKANGCIDSLSIFGVTCGNFSLPDAPPTIQALRIGNCGQRYAIETRALPRCTERIALWGNRIYGSVDLRTLPSSLVFFDLHKNSLTGRVDLTGLPRNLAHLNLSANYRLGALPGINPKSSKCQVPKVYYDKLPEGLEEIILTNTSIREICPTDDADLLKAEKLGAFRCDAAVVIR